MRHLIIIKDKNKCAACLALDGVIIQAAPSLRYLVGFGIDEALNKVGKHKDTTYEVIELPDE